MSIVVDDWDDLAEEPPRRGRRGRQPERQPAPAREPSPAPDPAPLRRPVPVPVRAQRPALQPAPAPDADSEREPVVVVPAGSAEREPLAAPDPAPVHEALAVSAQSVVCEPLPAPDPDPAREPRPPRALSAVPRPSPLGALSAASDASPMRARIAARAPSAVQPADLIGDWDQLQGTPAPAPAAAPPREVDMGVANFADDSYGDTLEDLRMPAVIAGANALFWLVGRVLGVVELVGVAFSVSIGLLLAAYVLREWQRDRASLICIAGALPLPLTIIGLFT